MKKTILLVIWMLQAPLFFAYGMIELDWGNTPFIAAVVKTDYYTEVLINTRAHWVKYGSLTDSYTVEERIEVEKIVDRVNLCNLQESIYEPCQSGRTVEEIKIDLMRAGVEVDKKFQEWAEKEI